MEVALSTHQFIQQILKLIHKNTNGDVLGFTRQQLEQFYRDLCEFLSEPQRAVVERIAFIRRWWSALEEILNIPIERVTRSLVQDVSFQRQIIAKLLPLVRWVGIGLQLVAVVADFGFNLYNMVQVGYRIRAALMIINDEEINDKFARLEEYIGRMKTLSDDIDKIIDPFKDDIGNGKTDNWTLPELENLLEQLNQKLALVDGKEYQANVTMINDLRERISRQHRELEESAESLRKIAVGTGIGAGVSAGLGIVGACSLFIPFIGPIISITTVSISGISAVATGAVCGVSVAQRNDALSRLNSAQGNLDQLGRYEAELQRTMQHIEELKLFKEQLAMTIERIQIDQRNEQGRRGVRGLLMNFWHRMRGYFW